MAQHHRPNGVGARDSWGTARRRARLSTRRAAAFEVLEQRPLLAAATQLVVATEPPASVVVNQGFGLVVDAEDTTGAVDSTYNGTVNLSLLDNPGSATLGGTVSVTARNGVAAFSGLSINQIANGYTLQVTGDPSGAGSLASATTTAINVTPLPATQLVVTTPPSGVTVNNPFTVAVSAENGLGQVDPTFNGMVTLALGSHPVGASLGGTLMRAAVNGVATFPGLTLDQVGSGYTLQFTTSGLIGAVTPSFSVSPAPATSLVVATQPPATVIAGSPFGLVIDAVNGQGQIDTNYNGPVSIAFASPNGNPAGASLLGTKTVSAVGGVATFSGLVLNKGGTGFVLQATSGGLGSATTNAFSATVEPATQLVFRTEPPRSIVAGNTFGVTVTAESAQGHLDPTYSGSVTIALANAPGAILSGTLTQPVVNGMATFSGLSLNQFGSGYLLQATPTAGDLAVATSTSIDVTPAPATHLVVTVQPPATVGVGSTFGLVVSAENGLNQVDPNFSGTVALALASGPQGAQLNGLLTATATAGVATFSGLAVDTAGAGYAIQATTSGLTSQTSTTFSATNTALVPSAPQLSAETDTGVSNSDGITQNNGTTAAPLVFTVTDVVPANGYVQLYNVTDPTNVTLLGSPTQAVNGTATVTLSSSFPLPDGTYRIAASTAANSTGTASAQSPATQITIATTLRVESINPAGVFFTSLPNNQIVVTFNHWLAGLVPDQADGSGFASKPFAVALIPSGPDGGALFAQGLPLWSAPSGFDSGDVAMPVTLVYHQNTDGTSTISLTPNQPLATDVYLVSINGLSDIAGNALTNANGSSAPVYHSFTFQASASDSAPLTVTSVTTQHGAVAINNNVIPQPDTIAIAFNKDMDLWTINTSNVQLLVQTGAGAYATVPSAVAYSPSTRTAYLTPEGVLSPGTVYVVAVSPQVTDDQGFPLLGTGLDGALFTSFTVSGSASGQSSPLRVTATSPANGTVQTTAFGYGAVTFSERISLAALGRYSAMLIPQTGGVTTGSSGYADVPLNAKLAFNPNTNQLIIVPTGLLPNNTVYLFALSGITASNGDKLTVPGGGTTYYASFLLRPTGASASVSGQAAAAVISASAPTIATPAAAGRPAVAHRPLATLARGFAAALPPRRPAQQSAGLSGPARRSLGTGLA